MSVEVFVDTNVLYYANTESPDPRHALARACIEPLWREPGKAAVSVNILPDTATWLELRALRNRPTHD